MTKIKKVLDAPKFGDKEYSGEGFFKTENFDNCYEYAVQPKIDIGISNPGQVALDFSIDRSPKGRENINTAKMIELSEKDGLQAAGSELPPHKDNYYLVAMYINEDKNNKDYHFIRQDQGGTWSQKFGTSKPVLVTDASGNIVSNPPDEISPKGAPNKKYSLKQYFYVPSGGINVGYDATFSKYIKEKDKAGFCKAVNILRDVGVEVKKSNKEMRINRLEDAIMFLPDDVHSLYFQYCASPDDKDSYAPPPLPNLNDGTFPKL